MNPRIGVACVALMLLARLVSAQPVQQPFADFLPVDSYASDGHVLYFTARLGQDRRVLFVCLASLSDRNTVNLWGAYARTRHGYESLNQLVWLRRDTLSVVPLKGVADSCLVTFWPSSPTRGRVQAFHLEDGQLVDRDLGVIEPQDKDQRLYAELFSNNAGIKARIEERLAREVLWSIHEEGLSQSRWRKGRPGHPETKHKRSACGAKPGGWSGTLGEKDSVHSGPAQGTPWVNGVFALVAFGAALSPAWGRTRFRR